MVEVCGRAAGRVVLAEILSDLGHDGLSEGQRQLARRAATISIACEKMEGEAAAGNEINLEEYGRLTDRLGRAFQRLGLERRARVVEPSLSVVARLAETRTRLRLGIVRVIFM
jgi:hypothetical protein